MGNLEQWEMEQKAQAQAYKRAKDDTANCAQTTSGMVGCQEEYRPTLRDRLKRQIEAAAQEQRRARVANELFDLLCKNPEVARILELREELHV